MKRCNHPKTYRVYRRGPKAKGSHFLPIGSRCNSCARFLPDSK